MAWPGFLMVGGNEVINNTRTAVYARALGITNIQCGQCPDLNRILDEPPYTSPDGDDAPWWDPAVPASKEFAGLLGLEVIGLDNPVNVREAIPLAASGAAISPVRRRPREIQYRALLLASSDCGLSYGRAWLAAAVRGSACGLPCVGDDLCFLACCPACEPAEGEDTCGDAQWRTVYNTGILSGPTPSKTTKVAGGWLQEVEFTFVGGNPFIYHQPVVVAEGPQPEQRVPGGSEGVPIDCVESTDCVRTSMPNCPPMPLPVLPLVPRDPCFPTGPFLAYRAVINLNAVATPAWLETVPYMRITAGAEPLRRLTIRWYSNPFGLDCTEALSNADPALRGLGPCDACGEINVPVVPANSVLTLDGRIERAWVDCPGGPGLATAEPYIYGRGGTLFQWPVFGCRQALCLEIIADDTSVTDSVRWQIFTVPREDAS